MPEIIDLSTLFGDGSTPPSPDRPQDLSGKPFPKSVTIVTGDGLRIPAEVAYDGIHHDGDRRYVIKLESRWADLRVTAVEVNAVPPDVTLIFAHGIDESDERYRRFNDMIAQAHWRVGRQVIGHGQISRGDDSPVFKQRRDRR